MKFISSFLVIVAVFILIFSALFFVFLFSSPDTVYTNISYGNHPQQKFDIYFPDKIENMSENSPVFLYIHGGGWTSGDKIEGKEMQKAVNDMGCIFVSMNYRLIHETNEVACSDMLCDIDDVVKYLALHSEAYHIDTDKMAIGGSSAGGHLAMLYAYSKDSFIPVQFVLSLSGPTDLADVSFYESKTLTSEQTAYLVNRLAGSNYSLEDILKNDADFPEFRAISPIFYIKKDMSHLVIVHGKADDLVPYKSAERMAAEMNKAGAEFDFFLFEYSGHDLGNFRDEKIRQDYFRTLIPLFNEKLDLNFANG